MIGVVVPVHNEQDYLPRCIDALTIAAHDPDLLFEPVGIFFVLDDCSDGSATLCAAVPGGHMLQVQERNVGRARAAGCAAALASGARWIACTDADTEVGPDWLSRQLALHADVVCGTIAPTGWAQHGPLAQWLEYDFTSTYRDHENHRHVHGANLGFSAASYRLAGGFAPLASGEDIALVARFTQLGCAIAWTATTRVRTSARIDARARGGFGDAIAAVAARQLALPKAA